MLPSFLFFYSYVLDIPFYPLPRHVPYATSRTQVFSSVHGDYFRELAGAKGVSKQIEYMREFGTAAAAAATVPVLSDWNAIVLPSDMDIEINVKQPPMQDDNELILDDPTATLRGGEVRLEQDL